MADITVSELTPIVKENNGIHFLSINGVPAVLSTEVARHFQKRHHHILRDIDRLRSFLPKSFSETNFGFIENSTHLGFGTRKDKAYLLTRDALSLLVMGMTGKPPSCGSCAHRGVQRAGGGRAGAPSGAGAGPGPQPLQPEPGQEASPALRRALPQAGLGVHAIAKLLDSDSREIFRLLKAAVVLGFLDPALGVGAGVRKEMGVAHA